MSSVFTILQALVCNGFFASSVVVSQLLSLKLTHNQKDLYSLETISCKFSEVLDALFRMSNDVIRPKDSDFTKIHPRLRETRFWPQFKD